MRRTQRIGRNDIKLDMEDFLIHEGAQQIAHHFETRFALKHFRIKPHIQRLSKEDFRVVHLAYGFENRCRAVNVTAPGRGDAVRDWFPG